MEVLGIDVGGSGLKAAPVDTVSGVLLAERYREDTPQPASPKALIKVMERIVKHFDWKGSVGVGFPAVIRNGVAYSAANVDKAWIGTNGEAMLKEATGLENVFVNDADAAALAELSFGNCKGRMGTVLVITLGTGIGTALFRNGHLIPNLEFGHIEINGKDAEKIASARVRKDEDLKWPEWGGRVNNYLQRVEALISPDLIVIGGGVSKKADKFFPYLKLNAEVMPASLENDAGIVGAAMAYGSLRA